ncbi:MAG: hypothetical protein AUJ57_02630 [Zetaproteobacteria bacterium CG1_02_53_45]|nr:MAG: hypothetical protein AUJ57_02630 [Zetaproteobacteria bacterium CG1_02_53_45]
MNQQNAAVLTHAIKDQQVRFEQLKLLYKPTILVAASYAVTALILLLSQWDVANHHSLLLWLAIMVAIIAYRVITFLLFKKEAADCRDTQKWDRIFLTGTLLSGLAWGASGTLFFPIGDSLHQIFLVFIMTGMAAGSTTTLSPRRETVIPFLLLLLTPVAYRLLTEGHLSTQLIGGIRAIALKS